MWSSLKADLKAKEQMKLHIIDRAMEGGEFRWESSEEQGWLICYTPTGSPMGRYEVVYRWEDIDPSATFGPLTVEQALVLIEETWVCGVAVE